MTKIKTILCAALMLAAMPAWAQLTEGVIVTSGDGERHFAISDISEITFTDEAMTVVTTSDATVEFPGQWHMTFGMVEQSGITVSSAGGTLAPVRIFTTDGRQIKTAESLGNADISSLPAGIYIIESNGKSIKIQR